MMVGDFVLVNSYMLQLVRPVEMLGYAMQGLSQTVLLNDTKNAMSANTLRAFSLQLDRSAERA
jgi:ABC-type transport system involved in Fe-S cluster assembly fused permease/ATPase subunit